jgi:predicted dinucleotide-utilizing enzyme
MHSGALSGLDVFKTARLNVRRLQPETVRTERNDTLS